MKVSNIICKKEKNDLDAAFESLKYLESYILF